MYQQVLNRYYSVLPPVKTTVSYLEDYCQLQYGNQKEITITNIPIRMNSHGRRMLNKLYEGVEPPEEYFEGSLFDVSCKDPFLLHHGIRSGVIRNDQSTSDILIIECTDTLLLVSYSQLMVPFRLQPGWVCSFVNFYSRLLLDYSLSSLFTASFYKESRSYLALCIPFFQLVVNQRTEMKMKERVWILTYDKKKASVEALFCIREMYDLEVRRYDLQCPESENFLKLSEVKPCDSVKKKKVLGGGGGGKEISRSEQVEDTVSLKRKKTLSVINAKQTDLLQGCSRYFSTLLQVYHLLSKGRVKFNEHTVEEHRSLLRSCIEKYKSESLVNTALLRKKMEVCTQVIGWLKTMRQLEETLVNPMDKRDREIHSVMNEKVGKQGVQVGEVNVRIYLKRSSTGQKQIEVVLENTKSIGWKQRQGAKRHTYHQFKECYNTIVPRSGKEEKNVSSTNSITIEDLFGDCSSSDED